MTSRSAWLAKRAFYELGKRWGDRRYMGEKTEQKKHLNLMCSTQKCCGFLEELCDIIEKEIESILVDLG